MHKKMDPIRTGVQRPKADQMQTNMFETKKVAGLRDERFADRLDARDRDRDRDEAEVAV